jgi:hypothetical protein
LKINDTDASSPSGSFSGGGGYVWDSSSGPSAGGYAGIWVTGSIYIENADVTASGTSDISYSTNFPTDSGPAFGIFAMTGNIAIYGNSIVNATAAQNGTPNGGRAAGIFSRDGDISISGTASVTATAKSKSAAAAGIYSEYGTGVGILSTGTVTASAESQSVNTDENEGLGIAAGGIVFINYATVNATGTSAIGESAGIAAAVPGDDPDLTPAGGDVTINDDAVVAAEGIGNKGYGIVVDGAGNVAINAGAEVTATAHGAGYSIDADTITNDGTANLWADDPDHYSNNTIGGSGDITTSINPPPTPPVTTPDPTPNTPLSGGGCDAGFGSLAAQLATGMLLRVTRRKLSYSNRISPVFKAKPQPFGHRGRRAVVWRCVRYESLCRLPDNLFSNVPSDAVHRFPVILRSSSVTARFSPPSKTVAPMQAGQP